VVLVDVWASWCRWCPRSLPFYSGLQTSQSERGFSYVGIDIDADPRAGRALLKALGAEQLVELEDREGKSVTQRLDIQRLPLRLLIDRTGHVRSVVQGYASDDEPDIRRAVDSLLSERSGE
jgi:thiol-disulfide isomerase/thioredoxin